jgi:release factor glutamine methyltransferase
MMPTLLEIVRKSAEFLSSRGLEHGRLDAELLIGHALGLPRMQLYVQFERLLSEAELEKVRPLVRRRAAHEPVQYIIGLTEFAGLELQVDARVLIPRPETERLVELLGERLADRPPADILDLGTGSGALALALAKQFPAARVVALDRSSDALTVARLNGARHPALAERVTWLESDWWSALRADATFTLIVANPPYLTEVEWAETKREVRDYEPKAALTAGDEGLADLRRIVAEAPARLRPGALLALETGIAQHAALLAMAEAAGLVGAESLADLTARPRYVLAQQKEV